MRLSRTKEFKVLCFALLIMVLLCFAPTGSIGQGPQPAPSSETTTPPPTVSPPSETPPQSTAGQNPATKSGPPAKPSARPAPTDNPFPVVPPQNAKVATMTAQRPQIRRTPFLPWPVLSQATEPANCSLAGGPPLAAPERLEATGPPLDDTQWVGPPMRAGFPTTATVPASLPSAVTVLHEAPQSQVAEEFPVESYPPTRAVRTTATQIANIPKTSRPLSSHYGMNRSTRTVKVELQSSILLYNAVNVVTKNLQDTKGKGNDQMRHHSLGSDNNLVNKLLNSIDPAKCKQVEASPGRK